MSTQSDYRMVEKPLDSSLFMHCGCMKAVGETSVNILKWNVWISSRLFQLVMFANDVSLFSMSVVSTQYCRIYLVSLDGGKRSSKRWRVKRRNDYSFFQHGAVCQVLENSRQRTNMNSSVKNLCVIITETHTHWHTHTECLTVCEPWQQQHFRVVQCNHRT